jgi:hypothetical protein
LKNLSGPPAKICRSQSRLIASICVIHNFLIDARDTVPEADILQAAAERNGRAEDDVDEEIRDVEEQNYQGATQEAFVRRSRWLDEDEA